MSRSILWNLEGKRPSVRLPSLSPSFAEANRNRN
jgi:hypothetical protein